MLSFKLKGIPLADIIVGIVQPGINSELTLHFPHCL